MRGVLGKGMFGLRGEERREPARQGERRILGRASGKKHGWKAGGLVWPMHAAGDRASLAPCVGSLGPESTSARSVFHLWPFVLF